MMDFLEQHRSIRKCLCILGGILLYAVAMDFFMVGNRIAAGGISGIAIVLSNFIPLDVGIMVFAMNVPILIVALMMNGWRYTLGAIAGAFLYSLAIQLLSVLPTTVTTNPLVAAVFGGAIYGAGMALLAFGNGSTGGTDLINRLLVKKFPKISLGKMSMLVDGSIVVFAMFAFQSIEVGLYAIITICVCSFVADRIVLGLYRGCLCMVVTAQDPQTVSDKLMAGLHRAVTKVDALGMYASSHRSVLYIAVRPQETIRVKGLLSEVDPQAFVMVLPANEVLGGTFQAHPSVFHPQKKDAGILAGTPAGPG